MVAAGQQRPARWSVPRWFFPISALAGGVRIELYLPVILRQLA
jgi:hypothetical protein